MQRFQGGDEAAFDELFASVKDELYRMAFGRLGDAAAAEDCLKEALVRVLMGLRERDPALPVRSWIRAQLRRVVLERMEGAR